MICEQMGHEPDPEVMPVELQDFPDIVIIAFEIFNSLRDTYIPSEIPIYSGKDLTSLPVLFDIYGIDTQRSKQFILKTINILDKEAIVAYQKKLPRKGKKPILPDVRGGSRI